MNIKQSSCCCCGFLTRVNQADNFFLLVGPELVASPAKPALLARFIQTAAPSIARSNSAKLATICIIMRPPAEVVSIASVRL